MGKKGRGRRQRGARIRDNIKEEELPPAETSADDELAIELESEDADRREAACASVAAGLDVHGSRDGGVRARRIAESPVGRRLLLRVVDRSPDVVAAAGAAIEAIMDRIGEEGVSKWMREGGKDLLIRGVSEAAGARAPSWRTAAGALFRACVGAVESVGENVDVWRSAAEMVEGCLEGGKWDEGGSGAAAFLEVAAWYVEEPVLDIGGVLDVGRELGGLSGAQCVSAAFRCGRDGAVDVLCSILSGRVDVTAVGEVVRRCVVARDAAAEASRLRELALAEEKPATAEATRVQHEAGVLGHEAEQAAEEWNLGKRTLMCAARAIGQGVELLDADAVGNMVAHVIRGLEQAKDELSAVREMDVVWVDVLPSPDRVILDVISHLATAASVLVSHEEDFPIPTPSHLWLVACQCAELLVDSEHDEALGSSVSLLLSIARNRRARLSNGEADSWTAMFKPPVGEESVSLLSSIAANPKHTDTAAPAIAALGALLTPSANLPPPIAHAAADALARLTRTAPGHAMPEILDALIDLFQDETFDDVWIDAGRPAVIAAAQGIEAFLEQIQDPDEDPDAQRAIDVLQNAEPFLEYKPS